MKTGRTGVALNIWDVNWFLDEKQCPCDVHFLEYLESEGITGASIFHFGTGGHHVVGIRTAENGSNNAVLGITASPQEYSDYIKLVIERPLVGRSYKAFFGDIYQLDARLLPDLDVVTLFHTGEFRTEKNDEYGALTDLQVAELLVDKLRPGGRVIFYSGSFAFDKAEAIAADLVARRLIEPLPPFKTLRPFRKTGAR
jgi:hypothetical protein